MGARWAKPKLPLSRDAGKEVLALSAWPKVGVLYAQSGSPGLRAEQQSRYRISQFTFSGVVVPGGCLGGGFGFDLGLALTLVWL